MTDSLRVHHTVAGQVLHRWREWEVAVLHPPLDPPEHLHENDYSLVVVLRRKSKNVAVWSGDLETAGEEILLRSGRAPEEVQVWKAGHHGSDTSGSQAWLDLMKPELILVSCGVGNGYGHPSHGPYVVEGDTLGLVRTDLAGSLRLEWDLEGNMTWKTVGPAGRDGPFP